MNCFGSRTLYRCSPDPGVGKRDRWGSKSRMKTQERSSFTFFYPLADPGLRPRVMAAGIARNVVSQDPSAGQAKTASLQYICFRDRFNHGQDLLSQFIS